MIVMQVVPRAGIDAYRLLRDKVTHEARTWSWQNRAKTRLVHKGSDEGYIEVGGSDGILVAQIHAGDAEPFFFAEKLIGRLIAWFEDEIVAINLQFIPDPPPKRRRARRSARGVR